MSRLICLNIYSRFDPKLPPFVSFEGFDSYLEKFGLDVRSSVLVWRVSDLLNPDGSIDFRLIARPIGWTADMIKYWSERLSVVLDTEV